MHSTVETSTEVDLVRVGFEMRAAHSSVELLTLVLLLFTQLAIGVVVAQALKHLTKMSYPYNLTICQKSGYDNLSKMAKPLAYDGDHRRNRKEHRLVVLRCAPSPSNPKSQSISPSSSPSSPTSNPTSQHGRAEDAVGHLTNQSNEEDSSEPNRRLRRVRRRSG